ncbi:uncharacterized protein F4812DRAFT_443854 [Daldinia caldariorum]|uniref:uncharacterized protein n=1 Tax=Daldinia caldariorum TaxID=326644 RepID=UPI00200847F3|nr:uncharacterized protein F4812DRAFT_443854 [Daldinia caldariorum]KAI1464238.1 hypothetical protein F4812DRAFT_443854 [Daldinia caldariorum]
MQFKFIMTAFFLTSLSLASNISPIKVVVDAIPLSAAGCSVEEGSSQVVKIIEFSFGQLDTHPGDIPPRLSIATISFFVTNPVGWSQACSGFIVQQQDGEWQDKDGSVWFKCGTESTPDPTCWNCTHFQSGWGHGSPGWHFAINQTWPCTSPGSACKTSYQFSGSTTLKPDCITDTNSYTSCTAPDFSLTLKVHGRGTSDPGCEEEVHNLS